MEDEGFGSCLSSAHLFPPADSSHLQPFKVLRGLRTRYPQTWHLITVHFPAEGIWGKARVRRIFWPCPGAGQKTLLWEVTSLHMRALIVSLLHFCFCELNIHAIYYLCVEILGFFLLIYACSWYTDSSVIFSYFFILLWVFSPLVFIF